MVCINDQEVHERGIPCMGWGQYLFTSTAVFILPCFWLMSVKHSLGDVWNVKFAFLPSDFPLNIIICGNAYGLHTAANAKWLASDVNRKHEMLMFLSWGYSKWNINMVWCLNSVDYVGRIHPCHSLIMKNEVLTFLLHSLLFFIEQWLLQSWLFLPTFALTWYSHACLIHRDQRWFTWNCFLSHWENFVYQMHFAAFSLGLKGHKSSSFLMVFFHLVLVLGKQLGTIDETLFLCDQIINCIDEISL